MNKKTLNLLIIHDSPQEHAIYREFLSENPDCDYQFIDAYSGEEGEKLYHESKIDCVLIDYHLPDIDGLEVLKRLTRNQEIVPAIMLTGEGNETVAVVAMQIGSQDYLPKRVITPQALKRIVDRAVERSTLMQKVESYRQDLERSNQDLERFAQVVAHDLKSPLRAITQHLQLVKKHNADALDKQSFTSIDFAVEGAERMRKLIDAVFEFSKIGFEKHTFTPVNLNLVLESVKSNLLSHIEESRATITSDVLPVISADSVQIMMLLQNLIANSLKFCKEKPNIHISAKKETRAWTLSVRDNGIGIPLDCQKKIFTIFRRLHSDAEYPGCGVGLAVCERIINNHGGTLSVESQPGKGSTFIFTLPLNQTVEQERAA